MARHLSLLVVLAALPATGCLQAITVGDEPGASGSAADPSFHAQAHGVHRFPTAQVLIGSDLPVDSGCALAGSEQDGPGWGARLVYAKFRAFAQDAACTEGVFFIADNPSYCSAPVMGELPDDCAVYKRWNEWGALAERVLATGGTARVTRTDVGYGVTRCSVRLDLQFGASGSYGDAFSVDAPATRPEGEALCTGVTCTPECPAWQRCTAGGCQDSATCIDHHVSCPLGGGPACCAVSGAREFSCNAVSGGAQCCVPFGKKCDFNDCCPPYRCSSDQTCR